MPMIATTIISSISVKPFWIAFMDAPASCVPQLWEGRVERGLLFVLCERRRRRSIRLRNSAYGYTPRHEDGRNFVRMVVPSPARPQRQPSTVLPPSVAAATGVPEIIGTSVSTFAPAIAARLVALPVTLILPLLSELPEATNLVGVIVQAVLSVVPMLVTFEFCTASVTPVRQPEAASTISETLARTV